MSANKPHDPSHVYPDDTPLAHVNMTNRARNALELGGFKTVGQVRAASDVVLRRLRNLGRTFLREIRRVIGGPTPPTQSSVVDDRISLRDYFAAAALPSAIATFRYNVEFDTKGRPTVYFSDEGDRVDADICAESAYNLADAMLRARACIPCEPDGKGGEA